MKKTKVAYLVSHPIQYQAPLLANIAKQSTIELKVFFCSNISVAQYFDKGFGRAIKWDTPLLEGYEYEFLPVLIGGSEISFARPLNYRIAWKLFTGHFDVLWIHGYNRLINWWAIIVAKIIGMKVLVRDEAWELDKSIPIIRRLSKRMFFRVLEHLCDGFLSIGTLNREYYRAYGVPDRKIFSMPYAVDNAFFQGKCHETHSNREMLRASLGMEQGRSIILFVGKLEEKKRPQDLLEAYGALSLDGIVEPNPYLIYVGDGTLADDLEKAAGERGWKSIRFLGFKNQRELPQYYDLCDVFVLPSAWAETWGLVVNEAMCAGKAIITSDHIGCHADLVKPGINGELFPAGDVNALAEKLRKLMVDPVLLKNMGHNSLDIIRNWSFNEDIKGLKEALSSVTAKINGDIIR